MIKGKRNAKNENTIVTSLVSKDEIQAAELNEMVEKTYRKICDGASAVLNV